MKTNKRKELQNIATNHSADNDFVRIYRECTSKRILF